MSESEAWSTLVEYARKAGAKIDKSAPLDRLRRTLAKFYHPRKESDDDRDMMRINSCIDLLLVARSRDELCGKSAPEAPPPAPSARTATRTDRPDSASGIEPDESRPHPWQPDPNEPATIERQDYTDLNFLRKAIYERSRAFGRPKLWKAWAWDGSAFRKVVAVFASEFAFEELGRALLFYQTNGPDPQPCRGIFLTEGVGRAREFRLVLIRCGRRCDDVSRYHFSFTGEPDSATFAEALNGWLHVVETQLNEDRSRW